MILYADDILILSPSVSQLEHLLHACESVLAWLDIAINFSKFCCIIYIFIRSERAARKKTIIKSNM